MGVRTILSYDFDELFGYELNIYGECFVYKYRKKIDPTITELEIPAKHNGRPVVIIESRSFEGAKYLKSVKIPKSVKHINQHAFGNCPELERVEFAGKPKIELNAFSGCPKLPPETVVMGLVRSTDITRPIFKRDIPDIMSPNSHGSCDCLRRDVFELLVKNDCFRECNLKRVFYGLIGNNKTELLPIAEKNGMLEDAELVGALINFASGHEKPECAAYLLDLKNRKFGFEDFNREDELELNELEELYRFVPCSKKGLSGYAVAQYLKPDDPGITELELPAEYKRKPVTMICCSTFSKAKYLKRVVIPASIRHISPFAFANAVLESVKFSDGSIKLGLFSFTECYDLERVEFGSTPPEFGPRVFHGCEKLSPEFLAMSMTRFKDRICRADYRGTLDGREVPVCDSFRPDIFEILAKNKCYKKLNVRFLFEKMINENRLDLLTIAEKYEMLENAALLELLLSYAIERKNVEATAYLLDLKNRKFGFIGGGDFEL